MRIAQVLLRYDAPGGVETHVRALSSELRRAGDDVTVYASDLVSEEGWVRDPKASTRVDGIPVQRFPAVKRLLPGLTLPLLPGLVRALDRDRPQVIHAHSHRYGHVLEAALVARARRIPLVVSTHYHPADPGEPTSKRMLLRAQDHTFGMSAYRTARTLVVESRYEAKLVSEFAPREKVRLVAPGIHLDAWDPPPDPSVARARLKMPQGYILYLGRLAPNKGLLTFLHAWAGLPRRERVPWVVAGPDWGMREALEREASHAGVLPEMRLLGKVREGAPLRELFAGARVFVLPSDYEAFGLVLLDAMAAGLPVLATSVGGVPEVVLDQRTGSLVPPGDAEAMREALRLILHEESTARLWGTQGRSRVHAEYSWERTTREVRAIYAEAVGAS